MTAQEMRMLAQEQAKPEIDNVIVLLKEAIENGKVSILIPTNGISELILDVLKEKGYNVKKGVQRVPGLKTIGAVHYWEISI